MANRHKAKKQLLFMAASALVFAIVVVCLVVLKIANLQNRPATEPTKNNQLDSSSLYLYQYKSKHFSANLGSKDVPNQPVVNFATNNSAIKYFPTGIDYSSIKQEKLKEDSVTYHNVWPGISFNYTFTEKAIKEDIYVNSLKNLLEYKNKKGNLSFEFKVRPQNALLRKQIIKGIEYYYFVDAATGEYRFRFEPPFMMDNNGRRSNNVGLSIKEIESLEKNTPQDEYTFLLTPDEKWLEKAVYPVRIDPTASVVDLYDDTTKIDTGNSSGYVITGGQAKINLIAWYSESGTYWNYREPVTYNNSGGGAKSNYDILVVVDTQTLINASKLQSDCDDLRFTDTDATTLVNYWIESGCNTSSTQIWVRIPTIAASTSETYYMYYGNSGASAGQQSWAGKIIVGFNASLPAGWSATTDLNTGNRFPRGAATYGGTGGSSSSHTHSVSNYTDYINSSLNNGNAQWTCTSNHRHSTSVTSSSATITQKYYDLYYGEKTSIPTTLPANSVMLFTQNTGSLPAGWSNVANMNGRFPRGNTTAGGTGGADSHSQTFSDFSVGLAGTGVGCYHTADTPTAILVSTRATAHTHPITGATLASTNHEPPYLDVDFATNASSAPLPTANVIHIFSGTPPMGWTRYTGLDSRFPRGSVTFGGTGGTENHDHPDNTGTTGVSGQTSASTWSKTASTYWYPLKTSLGVWDHDHDYTLDWNPITNLPPYRDVLFATRNSTAVATTIGSEVNAPKSATIQSTNLLSGISVITSLTSFSYSISTIPTGASATIQFSPDASTWYNGSCSAGSRESMSVGSNTITFSGGCWSTSAFYYKLALSGTGGNTPTVDDVALNYVYDGPPTWCTLEKGPKNNQIIINWNDPNSSEISYQIDKSTNGSWSSTPYYDTTVANVVTYTDSTSISAGNTYAYRVRAKFASSYSDWCYTVALTLGSGGFKFEGLKIEGVKID